ncbi:MAG: malonyl-CoA decarboxylase [Alphaproteobacteria bacterium]|nr:malonyl-CoA decarboxylase [Alphaproteobacteria bacterium]
MSGRSAGFFDGMFDRTLINLRRAWRDIAESARSAIGAPLRPDLPREDRERLREQMRNCLDGRGGEVSARARAAELGRSYLGLTPVGRKWFLRVLAESFDLDRAAVDARCADLLQASAAERPGAERALRLALEPPRVKLLTQFNALPEGVKFLVDMRAELMRLARTDPLLAALERDLKSLLASWFDIGFLELHRIDWGSPAVLLEKLMRYEAVHEIRGWTDLKNRLEPDRRCFGFFHPRMPEEPLIFVEVALVNGISENIQALLDESAPLGDPANADTAIFYSISNCQNGLAGISFGNFLIKRVVDSLAGELPGLKTFATLSPIPGFRTWLDGQLQEGEDAVLTAAERRALASLPEALRGGGLRHILERPRWDEDEIVARALREPLLRLCARYLMVEKTAAGRSRDPVAHFHLSNGARLERLDWLADRSEKGMQQSAGIMINYLYRLADIEENHEAYTGQGRVAAAAPLRALLRG